jgi:hypothetical protein
MTCGIRTTHRDLGHGRVYHYRKVLVCSLFFSFGFRATKINFWKKKKKKKERMKVHRLDQRSTNKGFVKIVWNFV